MNNKFKFLLLIILVLHSYNIIAQEEYNFFVVDTISLENPVLFNLSKFDGEFIIERKLLKKNSEKKRLIKDGYVFIYSNDFYYYLNNNKFKSYDYPDNGGCINEKELVNSKNLSYSKFIDKPRKFIVCLVKASYYNEKTATADIGKTYYHRKKKYAYYQMLFPSCE